MGQLTAREILLGILNWVLLTILFGALASWIWTIQRLWTDKPLLPNEPLVERRKTPWGVGTVLLVLIVYVLVTRYGLEWYALASRGETPRNQAAAPVRIEKKDAEHPDGDESLPWGLSLTELMFAQAAISEVLIILLPGLVWLTSGARLRDLGLSLAGWRRQAAVGTVAILLLLPIVYGVQAACVTYLDVPDREARRHPVEKMLREDPSGGVAYLAFVTAVVVAPAFEELLFRGIIQSWLVKALNRFARREAPSPSNRHDVQATPAVTFQVGPPAPNAQVDPDLDLPSIDNGYWETAEELRMPDGQEITERTKPDEILNSSADPNDPWPDTSKTPRQPRHPPSPFLTGLAIVLTSLFFAALHAPQWPAPIPLFLLSLGLGVVYLRTGSLLATICMHAIFNGISMLTLFYATLSGTAEKEPPARPVLERVAPVEKGGADARNVGSGPPRGKT